MGPYDIGVALQSTTAEYNRQAVEVDLASEPGGPVPERCGAPASIPTCRTARPWRARPARSRRPAPSCYFHGDGTYALNVSMYTDAQHSAFPGHTCSGGPTSTVSAHRRRRRRRPASPGRRSFRARPARRTATTGPCCRCPRAPRATSGGAPVTRSSRPTARSPAARSPPALPRERARARGIRRPRSRRPMPSAGPGRWACSVAGAERRQRRQRVRHAVGDDARRSPSGASSSATRPAPCSSASPAAAMRLTIPAIKTDAAAAAHGKVTVTISRATCASSRKGTFKLRKVLSRSLTPQRRGPRVVDVHLASAARASIWARSPSAAPR